MSKPLKNTIVTLVILVIALFLLIKAISYFSHNKNPLSESSLRTYTNYGITFSYPKTWTHIEETIQGNDYGSISLGPVSSFSEPFTVAISPNVDMNGNLSQETVDEMIARFQKNNENIYHVKDQTIDGRKGKEIFYNSAVTKKPYLNTAYFPFKNNTFISFSAPYDLNTENSVENILATLTWQDKNTPSQNATTSLITYKAHGIQFEYPQNINTEYLSFSIKIDIEDLKASTVDSNGCLVTSQIENSTPSRKMIVNSLPFCTLSGGGAAMGSLYRNYMYTTLIADKVYSVMYMTRTPNSCGVYKESDDISDLKNKRYTECLSAEKSYTNVVKKINESIATFNVNN